LSAFQIARALKRMTVLENLLLVPEQQRAKLLQCLVSSTRVYAQEQALRERAERFCSA
jgi:ABC-type branched-subunit amino acid transport system ATPase component